jgi:hypothetical protein
VRSILAVLVALASAACGSGTPGPGDVGGERSPVAGRALDPFDAYLDPTIPPTDGFDFPVGDEDARGAYIDPASGKRHSGWYVATAFNEAYALGLHPGEDWNGSGGGDTDFGQSVHAVGTGRVAFAGAVPGPWGNVVMIDHVYYVNDAVRSVRSLYAHLRDVHVAAGATVTRRERIGTIGKDPAGTFSAHLHLELRRDPTLPPDYWPSSNGHDAEWIAEHYHAPSDFIGAHRSLFVPPVEAALLLVDAESGRMQHYRHGKLAGRYDVRFGQATGPKRVRDDRKTPRGMYFVVAKSRGPFSGPYEDYFGGHWIKINYPNRYDAERGLTEGLVSAGQAARIAAEWGARRATWQGSRLGDGIGFHGWKGEWDTGGSRRLSWGCVVMHNGDIAELFDDVPLGAMVVIR